MMSAFRRALLLLALAAALAACGDDDETTPPDAASVDAHADAGLPDAAPGPDADPRLLSSRGLYVDIVDKKVVPAALEYSPSYPLWSDGAAKRRWIILPEGASIDTSDMDHWKFPVGTKAFKEFALDGKLLETRVIEVLPENQFFAGAFIWNEAQTEATLSEGGEDNVLGTPHDVPSQSRCATCHKGEPGFVLGFSALQLGEATLGDLATRLSNPPASTPTFPGDATARAAFGYLHANCGHCHNPQGTAYRDTCLEDPRTGTLSACMLLRFGVADGTVEPLSSAPVQSLIGQSTHTNQFPAALRVKAGDASESAIHVRANQRGTSAQMPPRYASEAIDEAGAASIQAWIDSLAP
jgi:hypothetical protein